MVLGAWSILDHRLLLVRYFKLFKPMTTSSTASIIFTVAVPVCKIFEDKVHAWGSLSLLKNSVVRLPIAKSSAEAELLLKAISLIPKPSLGLLSWTRVGKLQIRYRVSNRDKAKEGVICTNYLRQSVKHPLAGRRIMHFMIRDHILQPMVLKIQLLLSTADFRPLSYTLEGRERLCQTLLCHVQLYTHCPELLSDSTHVGLLSVVHNLLYNGFDLCLAASRLSRMSSVSNWLLFQLATYSRPCCTV